jgi:hypothetical protein
MGEKLTEDAIDFSKVEVSNKRGRVPKGKQGHRISFVDRSNAIHNKEIAVITVLDEDKDLVRELAVRQYLRAHDITKDYAARLLCRMYDDALNVDGKSVYSRGYHYLADTLGTSYPTVQTTVKVLLNAGIVSKNDIISNAFNFSDEAVRFFDTIKDNTQVLLTFEHVTEVQTEAINADGSINENFAN